ncbi:hypothetical protein K440DRAFT_628438 [Wilcoxina mikolae CBS 423.85]|nr:hypothetical protein K440DRAFT_628438 [Wilcoxina mikolae CBS 423.85]
MKENLEAIYSSSPPLHPEEFRTTITMYLTNLMPPSNHAPTKHPNPTILIATAGQYHTISITTPNTTMNQLEPKNRATARTGVTTGKRRATARKTQ